MADERRRTGSQAEEGEEAVTAGDITGVRRAVGNGLIPGEGGGRNCSGIGVG